MLDLPLLGFIMLLICAPDARHGRPFWVMPNQVIAVYHTNDAPVGCSKIMLSNGRTLFIQGTETEIIKVLNNDHS